MTPLVAPEAGTSRGRRMVVADPMDPLAPRVRTPTCSKGRRLAALYTLLLGNLFERPEVGLLYERWGAETGLTGAADAAHRALDDIAQGLGAGCGAMLFEMPTHPRLCRSIEAHIDAALEPLLAMLRMYVRAPVGEHLGAAHRFLSARALDAWWMSTRLVEGFVWAVEALATGLLTLVRWDFVPDEPALAMPLVLPGIPAGASRDEYERAASVIAAMLAANRPTPLPEGRTRLSTATVEHAGWLVRQAFGESVYAIAADLVEREQDDEAARLARVLDDGIHRRPIDPGRAADRRRRERADAIPSAERRVTVAIDRMREELGLPRRPARPAWAGHVVTARIVAGAPVGVG